MSVNPQENSSQVEQEKVQAEKEYNFGQIRKQLEQERQARLQAEERATNAEKMAQTKSKSSDDDGSYDEPYVDQKYFKKQMNKFSQDMEQKIDQKAEMKARVLIDEERRNNYLKQNNDFQEVMKSDNVQKFAEKYPGIAEGILNMPDSFERQKLVYENIKALGVNKPEVKQPSVQERIDQNKRSPYYQPSNVGTAPYASQGDFSPTGQKNAYDQMQELKKRLRV